MYKLLVVDDDEYISEMLREVCESAGYAVDVARSGTEALYKFGENKPDLVLLDLMMPELCGERVLPHLKGTPVIVVSAKSDVDGKVELLLGGAVDYVTKPFDVKELLARIALRLNRSMSDTIECGGLELDTVERIAFCNGKSVKLTRTECAILRVLMENPSRAFSKSSILERINRDTPDCTDASLKVHVGNLRNKLHRISEKEFISAVWGIGFKFED